VGGCEWRVKVDGAGRLGCALGGGA
jgi:hypothetical protein